MAYFSETPQRLTMGLRSGLGLLPLQALLRNRAWGLALVGSSRSHNQL